MFLFLIEQTINNDYDSYLSAIVVEKDADEASKIHPAELFWTGSKWGNGDGRGYYSSDYDWANPKDVSATLIGVPDKKFDRPQVILATIRAG